MNDRPVGIVDEKQTKLVQVVIWHDIAVHFVSIKIGSSIIKRVALMQVCGRQNPQHHKNQHQQLNSKRHALPPIPVQVVHHVHHQQIKLQQMSLRLLMA